MMMANPRLSAPFLVFLLIAILGLVLPDLASATISPGTDPVSDQTQASSRVFSSAKHGFLESSQNKKNQK
jgi:hypothetical protein